MPSGVYLHLAYNHLPVVGTLFVFLLCLVAIGRKSDELRGVALASMVLVALFALPAYFTGEDAEDAVERLPGVFRGAIHEHEEAAEFAFAATEALGVIGLIGLGLLRWRRLPRGYLTGATVVALGVLLAMGRTANLGGRIRHPEMLGSGLATGAGSAGEHEDGKRERD